MKTTPFLSAYLIIVLSLFSKNFDVSASSVTTQENLIPVVKNSFESPFEYLGPQIRVTINPFRRTLESIFSKALKIASAESQNSGEPNLRAREKIHKGYFGLNKFFKNVSHISATASTDKFDFIEFWVHVEVVLNHTTHYVPKSNAQSISQLLAPIQLTSLEVQAYAETINAYQALLYSLTIKEYAEELGNAVGLLSWLYLFGIPNSQGYLALPGGWPRNIDKATYVLFLCSGIRVPLCNGLSAFAIAIGYPPLISSISDIQNEENKYNTPLKFSRPHKAPEVTSQSYFKLSNATVDIKYVLETIIAFGHEIKDTISYFLLANYFRVGFFKDIGTNHFDNVLKRSSTTNISFKPDESGCVQATDIIIYTAYSRLIDDNDYRHTTTNLIGEVPPFKEKREFYEWISHLSENNNATAQAVMGEFYYYGHEAAGIERNVNIAADLWHRAAQKGESQAALMKATLHLQGQIGNTEDALPYLNQVAEIDDDGGYWSAYAMYLMYHMGLGVPKDHIKAGNYLTIAANKGNPKACILLADAHSSNDTKLIPPESKNLTLAMKYYKEASESDNGYAAFRYGSFLLGGKGIYENITEVQRCMESYDYFLKVAAGNSLVQAITKMLFRAYHLEDYTGALLHSMLLSEMGFMHGHKNAALLWKKKVEWRAATLQFRNSAALKKNDTSSLNVENFFNSKQEYSQLFLSSPNLKYVKSDELPTILEHMRTSEFLNCWAYPQSYYKNIESVTQLYGNTDSTTSSDERIEMSSSQSLYIPQSLNYPKVCEFYYLHRAASQGDESATIEVANAYSSGKMGAPKNVSESYTWIEILAMKGDNLAKIKQAHMLSHGMGIEKNSTLARKIYFDVMKSLNIESFVASAYFIKLSLQLAIERAADTYYKICNDINFELMQGWREDESMSVIWLTYTRCKYIVKALYSEFAHTVRSRSLRFVLWLFIPMTIALYASSLKLRVNTHF